MAAAAEPVDHPRLYVLNCGDMHVNNKGIFSDTGEYDGQTHEGISVCFVIRHPMGTLLWNSAVGDEVATKGGTVVLSGDLYHLRDNRRYHSVPGGNFSRATEPASPLPPAAAAPRMAVRAPVAQPRRHRGPVDPAAHISPGKR